MVRKVIVQYVHIFAIKTNLIGRKHYNKLLKDHDLNLTKMVYKEENKLANTGKRNLYERER